MAYPNVSWSIKSCRLKKAEVKLQKSFVVCVDKVICVHVCGHGQVQRLYGEQPHTRKQYLGGKDIKKKGTEKVKEWFEIFLVYDFFYKKLQHQKKYSF